MTDIEQPKANVSEAGRAVWDAYRQMMERDGVNIGEVWANWLVQQYRWLAQSEARADFSELCEAGCVPLVLTSIIGLIRFSPRLMPFWKVMLLHPKKRKKMAEVLEEAAAMLENLFPDVIAAEDENQKVDYAAIGHVPPSRLVSEIRLYTKMISLDLKLADELEVYSLGEFTKYILTGYVMRVTGEFHDRNVSGLTGAIADSPDHNEVAQRMWRYRNYERLEKHLSWIPDLLHDMGNEIADKLGRLT